MQKVLFISIIVVFCFSQSVSVLAQEGKLPVEPNATGCSKYYKAVVGNFEFWLEVEGEGGIVWQYNRAKILEPSIVCIGVDKLQISDYQDKCLIFFVEDGFPKMFLITDGKSVSIERNVREPVILQSRFQNINRKI